MNKFLTNPDAIDNHSFMSENLISVTTSKDVSNKQVRLMLDNEDKGNGVKLIPETHGMDVPSACTIVIIAGNVHEQANICMYLFQSLGKYLDKVDRVMTQVDRITEDIAHMPVAAFIFRNRESDKVHFSSDIRYSITRS